MILIGQHALSPEDSLQDFVFFLAISLSPGKPRNNILSLVALQKQNIEHWLPPLVKCNGSPSYYKIFKFYSNL